MKTWRKIKNHILDFFDDCLVSDFPDSYPPECFDCDESTCEDCDKLYKSWEIENIS